MMETIRPVSRATLSEQVAVQIADMIAAGKWKPNEKLPSEAELCRAFQVGRSTLREALKSLAYVGKVRMRHGEGTYVADRSPKSLERVFAPASPPTERYLTDLFEARMIVETEAAALCAQRASEEDLKQLGQIIDDMQRYLQEPWEGFAQLDVEFHQTIAACSQNQVLDQFLRTIRESLQEAIVKSLQIPGDLEISCAHHRKILEAIKRRNPRQARSAMRNHLRVFMRGYRIFLSTAQSESEARQETGDTVKQTPVLAD